MHSEHGKPDKPRPQKGKRRAHEETLSPLKLWRVGILSISEGEGLAGKGTKRKRMPSCNGRDRGFYNERIIYGRDTPRRKSADFEGGRD